MRTIKTICICGAGTMGSGIAQVAAMAGFTTIQFDVNAGMLAKSKTGIEKNLQWLQEKGKIWRSVPIFSPIDGNLLVTSFTPGNPNATPPVPETKTARRAISIGRMAWETFWPNLAA